MPEAGQGKLKQLQETEQPKINDHEGAEHTELSPEAVERMIQAFYEFIKSPIDDTPHLSEEEKAAILVGETPPQPAGSRQERTEEAIVNGIPFIIRITETVTDEPRTDTR